MKIYKSIFARHGKLLDARSRKEHGRIKASARAIGARMVAVGLYQMPNRCDGIRGKDGNLARMLSAISRLARQKVRIMVFPEMCLPGYFTDLNGTPEEARAAHHHLADDIATSPYIAQLRRAAREAKAVLAFGFSEKAGNKYYNSIGVIDADGRWLGARRKNPLFIWPYETDSFVEPPRAQRSAVFQTRYVRAGVSNCFDGEFPESIRQMRLDGAQVLLWSNAGCGNAKLGSSNRLHYAGCHAQANKLWVVCCNCVAKNIMGMSCIMAPNGEPLVVLPPDEEALGVVRINLALNANWDMWRKQLCKNVRPQMNSGSGQGNRGQT